MSILCDPFDYYEEDAFEGGNFKNDLVSSDDGRFNIVVHWKIV